jgi:thioredoxin-like negative regulator of GroEL
VGTGSDPPGNAPRPLDAAPGVTPLVLTLYSSSFCGACAQTRLTLEDAAGLLGGRVVLREVNVALDPDESERLEIMATPTTVLTDPDGRELARAAGVPSAPQVLTLIARHLPAA